MNLRRILAPIWLKSMPELIVQRKIHDTLFSVCLRDHALWICDGEAADAERIPFPSGGHVWDLGCNIGLYAVKAAKMGCKVTAFDISEINVLCLRQTALLNGLNIEVVHSPVTTQRRGWKPAETGHAENQMQAGDRQSITYLDAAERFGQPTFIKIDIQGSEKDLLMGPFRDWVTRNGITVYLEVHGNAAAWVWPQFMQIGPIHYLFKPS